MTWPANASASEAAAPPPDRPAPPRVATNLRQKLRASSRPSAPERDDERDSGAVSSLAQPAQRASETPEAPSAMTSAERSLYQQTYADVAPLNRGAATAGRPTPASRVARRGLADEEMRARARLGALVAGAIRFELSRSLEGDVLGRRQGLPEQAAIGLQSASCKPEAQVDLHGLSGDQAFDAVVRAVRAEHRRGVRLLLLIVGKGRHSEAGVGVLLDRAVEALHAGGAAPLVRAFATAHARHGGTGALLVQLQP